MGEIYPEDESGEKSQKASTTILDSFGTNLSKLAKNGELDPVIGRADEINRVVQILGRRRKNNPVLVGEPGVGKTSIVEGLAIMINEGKVPHSLQGKTIYTLELSTLVAGTKYRGQFEERMKAIIDEIKSNPNIIIFIDELHTLVGAGGTSGSLDASNIVKPALARGDIRCIGATTFDEFRENIESDGALDRRFQKVIIEQASIDETIEILTNLKVKYEDHHHVTYTNEIVELIVKLADRYINDRFFPDKAVDILDEVGSYKNLVSSKVPSSIKNLDKKLKKAEEDKITAVKMQDYENAAKLRDMCVNLHTAIESEMSIWKERLKTEKHEIVSDDVLYVVSKLSGVPIEKISEKENKELLKLNEYLSSAIIGQDEAINKVSTTIQRNRVGIRKRDRTAGNFIFLGPTGTGKTALAKKIAYYVYGSEDSMIRIDMSEYMERHTVSKLIGSPPGYVGYEEGGFLTEQVKNKPHSLVLFDEIEKAHPDVFNVMLQMLDDGYLTDSLGRKIDFRNCLIILTSNTGTRELVEFGGGIGFSAGSNTIANRSQFEKDTLLKALQKKFAPEFLNRIDEIVIFNKLKRDDIMKILEIELGTLRENLIEVGGYSLSVQKAAKEFIIDQGYDERYGARQIVRTLERLIENPISEMILKGEIKESDSISIRLKGESLVITAKGK